MSCEKRGGKSVRWRDYMDLLTAMTAQTRL